MLLGLLGSLASGILGSSSANRAAKSQEASAAAQLDLQKKIYGDQTKNYAPYLDAGNKGNAAYLYENGLGPKPAGYAGFYATPGYQFQIDQGNASINALAGAQGGLNSGRTLQDLAKFNQGVANQEYGNHLNRLQGLQSTGMGAAGNQANSGANYASGASNALANRGNALSAGAVGAGNAWQNAISNGIGLWQYQKSLGQPGGVTVGGGLFGGGSWG